MLWLILFVYIYKTGAEANHLEITPFYDAIIFSDVADVINEFENNLVSPS